MHRAGGVRALSFHWAVKEEGLRGVTVAGADEMLRLF